MFKIAEFIPSKPSALWKLAKQAGVDHAVGNLPLPADCSGDETIYDYAPMLRMKQRYEDAGFSLNVIEARPSRRPTHVAPARRRPHPH